MTKSRGIVFLVALALVASFGLSPLAGRARADDKPRLSPHEEVSATIGGKSGGKISGIKVTIQYGRPYKKGRAIFGGLVPYGRVWRTGADEATTLTTDGDLLIGTLHVPKGSYALFTLPEKTGWTLVVNKTAHQWGAFSYNAKDDLGRAPMKLGATTVPVEQFTIAFEPAGERASTLKLSWDTTLASVTLAAP